MIPQIPQDYLICHHFAFQQHQWKLSVPTSKIKTVPTNWWHYCQTRNAGKSLNYTMSIGCDGASSHTLCYLYRPHTLITVKIKRHATVKRAHQTSAIAGQCTEKQENHLIYNQTERLNYRFSYTASEQ